MTILWWWYHCWGMRYDNLTKKQGRRVQRQHRLDQPTQQRPLKVFILTMTYRIISPSQTEDGR